MILTKWYQCDTSVSVTDSVLKREDLLAMMRNLNELNVYVYVYHYINGGAIGRPIAP